MKRKTSIALLLIVCLACMQGAFASTANEAVVGNWSGKLAIKFPPISVNTTVEFTGDSYTMRAMGIESTGAFTVSGTALTIIPTTPTGVPPTTVHMTLDGNKMTMVGTILGIDGTVTLTRSK